MYEKEGQQEGGLNQMVSGLRSQIEQEIQQYLTEKVEVGDGYDFSQAKLVRRIGLFETHTYPTGKFDSQGNYKFWFDIITPRIDSEVKNIDLDTRDASIYSPRKIDALPMIVANLALDEYMRTTGQAEELNTAVEEFSGWGNVLWKKVRKSYERCDLRNTYVINQTARTVDQTPIIERHTFLQSELRAMEGKWSNVSDVVTHCASKTYKTDAQSLEQETTIPYYEVYERNGEVCLKDLKEVHNQQVNPGDENKYVFARVVAAGVKSSATGVSIKYILFAGELKGKKNSDIYKEAHRGRYKGRWWREGLYELLFDIQVRANQIGNQMAQGLELAAKNVFQSPDKLVVQNVMTDIRNGDIIKASDLKHVEVRMNGFDQLANEWNRLIQLANDIANSREVVTGDSMPSGTPFRLGALYNQNANKLFDLLREKLSIPLSELFEEWIAPGLCENITAKEILRLTGDSDMLARLHHLIVEDWYLQNLIAIGPHSPEEALMLKSQKLLELQSRPQLLMKGVADAFENFVPHATVEISGENSRKGVMMETYGNFIQMELDPVRRSHMIEAAMKRAGLDVGGMPRLSPEQLAPQGPAQPTQGAPVQ